MSEIVKSMLDALEASMKEKKLTEVQPDTDVTIVEDDTTVVPTGEEKPKRLDGDEVFAQMIKELDEKKRKRQEAEAKKE